MNPTLSNTCATRGHLARFNGDRTAAVEYCHNIISQYPHLRDEYKKIVAFIAAEKAVAAHA